MPVCLRNVTVISHMSSDKTTVTVDNETWKRLTLRKEPGDSFDDVIRGLLDEADKQDEKNGDNERVTA